MVFNKINTKKIQIILLLFGLALYVVPNIYYAVNKSQTKHPENSTVKLVQEKLSKYPVEAQKLKITKLCQEMQKPLLIQKGIKKELLDIITLPVCTCISAAIMMDPTYKDIESMANNGSDFFQIVVAHKQLFMQPMNNCK